jgi:hypothetical protein
MTFRHFRPNIGARASSQSQHAHCTQSLKGLLRRAEMGTGDTYGFLWYNLLLWFLLIFGLVFAFAGFYRIGANYANDYGVRIGAVYTGDLKGEEKQEELLGQFSRATHDCPDCYSELPTERQAQGGFTTQSGFLEDFNVQGTAVTFNINAQSRVRLERFYPGPAKCDAAGDCFE